MNALLDFMTAILNHQPVAIGDAATLLATFITYKIAGKYVEEFYFRIFPFKSLKRRIADLERMVVQEMKRAETMQRMTRRLVKASNKMKAELIAARGELSRRRQR